MCVAQENVMLRVPPMLSAAQQALQRGQWPEAVAGLQCALQQDPLQAVAWHLLGCALQQVPDFSGALLCQQRAVELDPDLVEALSSLIRVKEQLCDWDGLDALQDRLRQRLLSPSDGRMYPFSFFTFAVSNQEMRACSSQWGTAQSLPLLSYANRPAFDFQLGNKPRLRIGYLSAHLSNHATGVLMAEVFALHRRDQFEILAYSAAPVENTPLQCRLRQGFDVFNQVADLSDLQLAEKIHADGVDILVDLDGYTHNSRTATLAFRPAPLQVSYLGFAATLGVPWVDYLLTDKFVTPPDQAQWFAEKFAYLPDCYQCNDRQREIGVMPSRAACGLPESALVLCCFNQSYKINPQMFALWCQILQALPASVLWLLSVSPQSEDNLRQAARLNGIDPDRLIFAQELPLSEHLGRLRQADLMLDTWPMNAHTTASDALWAGVPLVTCPGTTFAGRVAGSLLLAVGLAQCIADSWPDYVELVCALGRDKERRLAIKAQLAQGSALPLFDTPRLVRAIESLYQAMWVRRIQGLPADHLDLSQPELI
jgi:protein O-GlcNAc transferase